MKTAILLFAMLTATVGCSTHYRTTDPQVSSDELMQWLGEASSSSFSGTDISTLAEDPNTVIYFADSTLGTMGGVATVLAFDNIDFLDPNMWIGSVRGARVFFLDNPATGQDALVVGLNDGSSGFQYHTFSGGRSIDSGLFEFAFQGADGNTYYARSYDTDGDSLNSDIQLKIFTFDTDGAEIYVGKFSILAGFQ